MEPARRLGWVDRPTTRKHHSEPIPCVGGLVLWFVFTLGLLFFYKGDNAHLLILCISSVALSGFLDDLYHLRAVTRLVWQFVTVLVMAFVDPSIRLVQLGNLLGSGELEVDGFAWILTTFAVSGMINAFNMIDGLDGLAAGLALVAIGFMWICVAHAGFPMANMLGLLEWVAAALIGFLLFNLRYPAHPRATIFLGDAGSTLLGFVVTCFMLQFSQSEPTVLDPVTALCLVALPLLDTVTVMLRRLRMGLSPFAADRQHLHHLLLGRGFSDGQVVFLMIGASVILAFIGVFLQWSGLPEYFRFYAFLTLFAVYYWTTSGILRPSRSVAFSDERRNQPRE